ncbi:ATP-binding protein [Siphonobacter curvatus]|uniref:Histidine kinase n=1 Tax=Siphonobacter curvatus TaxID=2094562 RepID=A0A2S7IHT2_9BACT|nr:ATP-binding protein [Siphonobacter curvatus]PQA55493.1 histidine kinase [Siphonobacter curvatus]
MNALDRQVARRLTRYYLLALHVIALLSIGGLWFIRQTIHTHYADSRVLNVAGRQRMLSQRLTKLALLRLSPLPSADSVLYDSLLQSLKTSHEQLKAGVLIMEKEYTVRRSPTIDRMFQQLEPVFQAMYQSFVWVNTPGQTPDQQRQTLTELLKQEPVFLQRMNALVFQFDAESTARVNELERLETILTLATLLTLLLEGLFVFRPVVQYTKQVIRQLTQSEEALQESNEQLALANEELRTTQEEVLRLSDEQHALQRTEDHIRSAALLEGQEEERRRFARELHDGIGQMLTGLYLQAAKFRKVPFPEERQRQRADELVEAIQLIIQTTRQISHNLMPTLLGDYGLAASLQLLADQLSKSASCAIRFEQQGEEKRLAPAQEIALYRIAQEAVTNALKHAKAGQIALVLHYQPEAVTLRIQDDGVGIAEISGREGSGLENMQTRAQLLQATFQLHSIPGKGTWIEVHLPLG